MIIGIEHLTGCNRECHNGLMLVIDNRNKDPYLNHAIEEYLVESLQEDCFILWQNSPCVLIGRNQNVYAEINMDYIRANNIDVVRRITGGGTVFNDNGNFNFTFIASKDNIRTIDFIPYTTPILNALRSMGILAEFKGRNDLVIEGRKFSGNAQCVLRDKVLHHGTLLFDADMHALTSALNVNNLKLNSNNVKSVRSRVTNISNYLPKPMTIDEFKNRLLEWIYHNSENARYYQLTNQDIKSANEIANARYRLDGWNFPRKLDFTLMKEMRYDSGLISCQTKVHQGLIQDIRIYGDFFGTKDIGKLQDMLVGIPYNAVDIEKMLSNMNIDEYIRGVNESELISLII